MIKSKRKYFLISLGIIVPVYFTTILLQSGNANNQPRVEEKNMEMKLAQKNKKPVSFTDDILPLFVKPKKKGKTESIPCIRCHFSSLTIESNGIPENAMTEFSMGSY